MATKSVCNLKKTPHIIFTSSPSTTKIVIHNQDDDNCTENSSVSPSDYQINDSDSGDDNIYMYAQPDYNDVDNSTDSGMRSSIMQNKKDNGHHIVERAKKNGKKQIYEFYETFIFPKSTIRNAITGEKYYRFYVGTTDENLFFKVIDATAPVKNKDPYILFYDNPEQYERYTNNILSKEIKQTWNIKYLDAVMKYKQRVSHKNMRQK